MPESALLPAIVLEQVLPSPAAKVWRVLTEPALRRAWLMEGDFRPEVGYRSSLQGRSGLWEGVAACEVREVESERRLACSWRGESSDPSQGRDTQVTWTLTPVGTGTRVRVEHSGFRTEERVRHEEAERAWKRSFKVLATVTDWLVA
jgi:uncharacterized protein YndB with AHSA1/START domain